MTKLKTKQYCEYCGKSWKNLKQHQRWCSEKIRIGSEIPEPPIEMEKLMREISFVLSRGDDEKLHVSITFLEPVKHVPFVVNVATQLKTSFIKVKEDG